ncbi:MAG: hypothetical protein FWC10_10260, partial [Lentimicrobiaceae bacterium]|nr:hypothetical protein [Lentimicrobiaceae bacterium]
MNSKIIPLNAVILLTCTLFLASLSDNKLMAQSNATIIDLGVANSGAVYTNWSCSGNTYTVTGNISVVNSGTGIIASALTFAISPTATVAWSAKATYSGTNNSYLVTVSGGGTLDVTSCTLSNTTGTGGIFNIPAGSGSGTTIIVGADATIVSGRSGSAIQIAANGVTLEVKSGGTVESDESNGNAALLIASDVQSAVVNVNGGSIVSVNGGLAISDGSAFTTITSNST